MTMSTLQGTVVQYLYVGSLEFPLNNWANLRNAVPFSEFNGDGLVPWRTADACQVPTAWYLGCGVGEPPSGA